MPNDLDRLADAFNQAVKAQEEAAAESVETQARLRADLDQERARRAEEARVAREALYEDLVGFARRVHGLRAERVEDGLVLASGEHAVALQPDRDGGLVLGGLAHGEGDGDGVLSRDVSGAWVLTAAGRHLPLVPHGLALILTDGLGLPRPEGLPDPGPPVIQRPPRVHASIAPPRPPVKRDP